MEGGREGSGEDLLFEMCVRAAVPVSVHTHLALTIYILQHPCRRGQAGVVSSLHILWRHCIKMSAC